MTHWRARAPGVVGAEVAGSSASAELSGSWNAAGKTFLKTRPWRPSGVDTGTPAPYLEGLLGSRCSGFPLLFHPVRSPWSSRWQRPGFPSGDRFLTRVLLLIIGLGAAAIAGYVVLSGVDLKTLLASSAAPARPAEPAQEHDQIDEKSRERLRAILREADAAPGG